MEWPSGRMMECTDQGQQTSGMWERGNGRLQGEGGQENENSETLRAGHWEDCLRTDWNVHELWVKEESQQTKAGTLRHCGRAARAPRLISARMARRGGTEDVSRKPEGCRERGGWARSLTRRTAGTNSAPRCRGAGKDGKAAPHLEPSLNFQKNIHIPVLMWPSLMHCSDIFSISQV